MTVPTSLRLGARCIRPPGRSGGSRRAFTLTELIVVIAIIVLLVSLLLVAMGRVQEKSRATSTLATMQAFANACEAFKQEHGFYPGVVPENILIFDAAANDGVPQITGTENAMLHLIGGVVRRADMTDAEFDSYTIADGWFPFSFAMPGGNYDIKINRNRLGEGPVINGKPHAPYFTPSEREIGAVEGQLGDPSPLSNRPRLPDLIDAWGQPIIFLRRMRSVGPLTRDEDRPDLLPQFDLTAMRPYCDSDLPLGRLGRIQRYSSEQLDGSILSMTNRDAEADLNCRKLLEHPALANQARGAFLLLSAGGDGIYLSAEDGAGSNGNGVPNVGELIEDESDPDHLPPSIYEEYDDVVHFGGS